MISIQDAENQLRHAMQAAGINYSGENHTGWTAAPFPH